MSKHSYVYEILYHFNCGDCKNWWSYASSEFNVILDKHMHCPHCGAERGLEVKDNLPIREKKLLTRQK